MDLSRIFWTNHQNIRLPVSLIVTFCPDLIRHTFLDPSFALKEIEISLDGLSSCVYVLCQDEKRISIAARLSTRVSQVGRCRPFARLVEVKTASRVPKAG